MAITIFFCLVLSVSVAGAATLTKVSGTFSDGQKITITGSGFGTAPASVSFITGESETPGNPLAETGWMRSTPSAGGAGPISTPKYSNAKALNGKNSIICSFPNGTYGCTFDLGYTAPISKAYISFWVYGDYKTFLAAPNNHFQWKMFRVNSTTNVNDSPSTFMISQWPKSDGSCLQAYVVNYIDTTYKVKVPDGNAWRTCFPRGEWIRMEVMLQESDLNVANGTEVVNYYSTTTNSWKNWTNYKGNVITRATADRWKYIHFGHYMGNESVGKNADSYWDNIYIQQGTFARVELCDSSSWSTCQKRQVQKPESWTANSLIITANSGPFTTGKQVYLFFIDDAGNASNGLPVTIGATLGVSSPSATGMPR
jgi:hypothetical protein